MADAMIRLRWNETVFFIEFSFFFVAALAGLLGGTAFFFRMMFACLLHECGHWFTMVLFHQPVRQVFISGAGILICPGEAYTAYWKDLIVSLSGPFVNICIGFAALYGNATELSSVHLALGIFNLLPYPQLDGGAALYACFGIAGMPPHRAQHLQTVLALVFSLILFLLLLRYRIYHISLYCVLLYITICVPLQDRYRNRSI